MGSYPLLSLAPTPVEVELGCDNNCSSTPVYLIQQVSEYSELLSTLAQDSLVSPLLGSSLFQLKYSTSSPSSSSHFPLGKVLNKDNKTALAGHSFAKFPKL